MNDPMQRVLVVPHPCLAVSHVMTFVKIGLEATNRGYGFTMLLSKADHDAVTEIGLDINDILIYPGVFNRTECLDIAARYSELSPIEVAMLYVNVGVETCKSLMSHKPTWDVLQESGFDVFFGDLGWPCTSLVADKMDQHVSTESILPRIMFQGNIAIDPWGEHYGVPSPATEIPQLLGSSRWFLGQHSNKPMSLFSRLLNTVLREVTRLVGYVVMLRPYTALRQQAGLSPTNIVDSIHESNSLIVIPAVWGIEPPRALPPNWKVVHPILPSPPNKVGGEIGRFIEETCVDKGLVVVSFGTQASLSLRQVESIFESAASLRNDFCLIWRLPRRNDRPTTLANTSNLMVVDWLPQNDLLGHPNTRAFVSHVGHGSLYEAAYHGVPIVGIPIFGDQEDNIHRAVMAGFGIRLDKNRFTARELATAVQEAAGNDAIRKNAEIASTRTRAQSGIDEVLDWMDYARIHGVNHLVPHQSMSSSYFAYYNLDVGFVLGGIAIGAILLVYRFAKRYLDQKRSGTDKQKAD